MSILAINRLLKFTYRPLKEIIFTMPFYAVAKGKSPGIYETWAQCEANVKCFSGARYKKFDTPREAQDFIDKHSSSQATTTSVYSKNNLKRNPQKRPLHNSNSEYSYGKKTRLINICDIMADSGKYKTDSDGYVQVYTDGACSSNGKNGAKAGIGVYFGENHKLNVSEPVSGRATNNCGEIQAATKAIDKAQSAGISKLCINTDSKFVIDSVTKWMKGWKRNNWKLKSGGPVKNQEDFVKLDEAMQHVNVKWNYVEAHKGIFGNERADQLAKDGAAMYDKY